MHRTHDPGTTNRMEGAHTANRRFVPEPTTKYNAGIQYSRLIHRCCASLDLEATFKEIKISQNIEKDVCAQCQSETCRCPAFMPGTPCSSASSTPTDISDEHACLTWWQTNCCKNCIFPPKHLPTKRQIEKSQRFAGHPEYYRVRSHVRRRRRYFLYNALDDIGETTQQK